MSTPRILMSVAVLIACAGGYTLQSRERAARPGPAPDIARIAAERARLIGIGPEAPWIDLAAAMRRAGETQTAVLALRSGISEHRRSPDLWQALGDALRAHDADQVRPPARLAYWQAARLRREP